MKLTGKCSKCACHEIAIIEGGMFKGNHYNIIASALSTIYLTRYVCTRCGYTENYVDSEKDLAKIKKKFYRPPYNDDYV